MKFLTTTTLLLFFVFIGKGQSSFFVDDAENVYKCGPDWVKKYAPGDTEGIIVAGGNGQGGNANQLKNPRAVIVDEKGDVFICDTENHRIQKWEKGAKTGITVAGGNGEGNAANQLNYPNSFVFDSKGNLFVGDFRNSRIQKWEINSKTGITVAGGKGEGALLNQFNRPLGFVLENDTTLYISNDDSRILKWNIGEPKAELFISREIDGNIISPAIINFDKNGTLFFYDIEYGKFLKLVKGSRKSGIIQNPYGYFFLRNGEMWVLDYQNKISKYIEKRPEINIGQFLNAELVIDGNAEPIIKEIQIDSETKIYQDKKGNIYLIESEKQRILKVNPDGKSYKIVAGGNGKGNKPNQFDKPSDIIVDDNENIFVVDTYNHRIQKWGVNALEGITVAGGNGNGKANNQLNSPKNILFDSEGNLIINDRSNHRIVKWNMLEKSGITIAGGNGVGSNLNQFQNPENIFLDSVDNLYILDSNNNRVIKWDNSINEGISILKFQSTFGEIDFAIDKDENIFISNYYYSNLAKYKKGNNSPSYLLGNDILSYPNKLMINNSGELIISNIGFQNLIKYNTNSNTYEKIIQFSKVNSASNQLAYPSNIYINTNQNIFINDGGNRRIQKFNKNSLIGETVGSSGWNNDLYVDTIESVYSVDNLEDGIKKWLKESKEGVVIAGGNGNGILNNQLNYPRGIWVSNKLTLYITDAGNNRIQKWGKDAKEGNTIFGTGIYGAEKDQLAYPFYISLDKDSSIFVLDMFGLSKINKEELIKNTLIPTYNYNGRNDNQIGRINNAFIDDKNNFYANDFDKIIMWDAKTLQVKYIFQPRFQPKYPNETVKANGFSVDKNGILYIADGYNNRILKVNPNVKIAEKSASQKTLTEYNGAYFLTQTNDLIAKIIPDEANLAMGEVTATVIVDTEQSESYVKRHYKIETNNPAHKAKITLYFKQTEFDEYNKLNTNKLPTNPNDKTGIANLFITSTKITNRSRALTAPTKIEVPDNQIVWNDERKIWEISFEDNGSKEYWLKTKFEFKKSNNPRQPRPFEAQKYARQGVENEVILEKDYDISPNPATKTLALQIYNPLLIGTRAFIKNEIGIEQKSIQILNNEENIDIEKLPTGMYFIHFQNGKTTKFIKQE